MDSFINVVSNIQQYVSIAEYNTTQYLNRFIESMIKSLTPQLSRTRYLVLKIRLFYMVLDPT